MSHQYYYYKYLPLADDDMPHMLIHGSYAVGKKTLATQLVQSRLPYDMRTCPFSHEFFRVETSSKKMTELNTWMRKGKYHIELDFYNTQPSYDVHIVSHILKSFKYGTIGDDGHLQRVYVMLFHFEKASMETQFMLRRKMEKMRFVTFIITTRNVDGICDSMRSRFFMIRLPRLTGATPAIDAIHVPDSNAAVHDVILHYRKWSYEQLLVGIEPIDVLKAIHTSFKQSGYFDVHTLIDIFANNNMRMLKSTKPIYHVEYAVYQAWTTARFEK